ncbi:protein MODIFYING WALL LIGNIN-2 isoform X1 [Arachis duranensis]|uniref:Protein MODIFYING WALL LIGNIN-2 isoform X1 n=1 Tax=Arachis duranensis TaxID=130453 RepID=A0A9C6TUN6_ARADU|nr:protein MODIFYING WALL LIGNIN-2 isoform X1 [Arachis duranensis]
MARRMAVTHADLEPRRSRTDLSSKTGAFLMVLTILLGLLCFILCLIAEATRSQVTWMNPEEKGKDGKSECVYSGSGKVPLLCATSAFVGLAIAMLMEHTYMLIAVTKSSPALLTWDPDSASAKSLTWLCFAVSEILLLAGLSVESGHLNKWSKARTDCYTVREGIFSAAGVFALTTVFLEAGLYLTALRAQRLCEEIANVRREVLEASAFYSSPPQSPHQRHLAAVPRENPTSIRDSAQTQGHQLLLSVFPTPFNKTYNIL